MRKMHRFYFFLSSIFMNSSSSNPWFGVAMGLVGFIVGFGACALYGTGVTIADTPKQVAQAPVAPTIAPPPQPQQPSNPATVDDDPSMGEDDAPLTLIEFTDYQCPYCSRHYTQTYSQIKENYVSTGKVKYVIRDYPLSFHPHAQITAEATECADDQKKFWEMHDKIFATQANWSQTPDVKDLLKQYASELKLNTTTFNTCLDSGTHKAEVQKDLADGAASGVGGTPGFWLVSKDGKSQYINGAMPYATFQQAFDSML